MAYASITKPSLHFNTKLYTGTGSSNAITGVGFQPDWTWIKVRSNGTYTHALYDAVRGVNKPLMSSANTAEGNDASGGNTSLNSFDSDGFTLGGFYNKVNQNGETFVSWNWKANGAGSSNTDGSINTTSTSVNTTADFSISKYTGTGSTATVGHGLGVVPEILIIKDLSAATDWTVYHVKVGNTKRLVLNSTATTEDDASFFNDTTPTSSVFTVGSSSSVNLSGRNYICYAFASVKGYSKFGSYTGNGNADGTFVYTGFKPAWLMIKSISSGNAQAWMIYDSKRNGMNTDSGTAANRSLRANASDSEATASGYYLDILSNGFKCRDTSNPLNLGSNDYIYMAFAEEPLVANVGASIPATAR